jgi:ABC-type transporter Mla subunit MlaD
MTREEMEKTMEFILEQQAQTTATIGRLSDRVDALSEKVERNADGIKALLAITEIQAAEMSDLRESTRDLARSIQALDGRQRESDERGRRADERLNALINIVERHISEGRNGKS